MKKLHLTLFAMTVMLAALLLIAGCSKPTFETEHPQETAQQPQQQASQAPVGEPGNFTNKPPLKVEQKENVPAAQAEEFDKEFDMFYHISKPHWAHMPVTYAIVNEKGCGRYEANKMRRAFGDIRLATNNTVSFEKVNDSADIEITCVFLEDCYKLTVDISGGTVTRYETICGHDLGFTRTTLQGNRLLKADIQLIGLAGFAETKGEGPSGFYVGTCGHAITELHEILHAFGYGHSEDNSSIMYSKEDSFGLVIQKEGGCVGSEKEIDKDIVEDLISTYSRPAASPLREK